MKKIIKVGSFVKGVNSPFVHGQVAKVDKAYAYLDNGGVYPLVSLVKITKIECKALPDFIDSLKKSKSGLNIFSQKNIHLIKEYD